MYIIDMSFFNSLVQRVGYGTIMYNGNASGLASCYPFFTSQSNLAALTSISSSGAGTINIADVDDYWIVMPGYKIIVYDGTIYSGSSATYDNTGGTVPVNYKGTTANIVASFQLYFKNVLIDQPPVTYDTLSNGVTVSNYANASNLTYNSVKYLVYEFYAGSTGTISVPAGSSTVSNIQCLLIGGGGSGSHNNQFAVGVGGGGAGAFLTTTLPVASGDRFTINVGAGGAQTVTNRPGNVGLPSSIQRTTGGQTYTLTAGGGGGGGGGMGGFDSYSGNIVNPWGSTGGVAPWAGTYPPNATVASNSFTQTSAVFGTVSAFVNPGGTVNYVDSGTYYSGGSGGGGAGGVGGSNTNVSGNIKYLNGGNGGPGKSWTINGVTYAGGGGGHCVPGQGNYNGIGGTGGGGAFGVAGKANTGSGGGSGYATTTALAGGSGICIIAIPV